MNTNSKQVRDAMKDHVISFFTADNEDAIAALTEQAKTIICDNIPTLYHAGKHMAEGGCFLIYNGDIADFLNGLGINPTGKQYDEMRSFNLYSHLCGLAVERIARKEKTL